MKINQFNTKCITILCLGMLIVSCKTEKKSQVEEGNSVEDLIGDWASFLPSGHAVWLTFYKKEGKLTGEVWNVGMQKKIVDPLVIKDTFFFKRNMRIGKPDYIGGPPTGEKQLVNHKAFVKEKKLHVVFDILKQERITKQFEYIGERLPVVPSKPDLSKVTFGKAVSLFNGENLTGWILTNENQLNGWRAENGVLINETPKLSFEPFSHYGNLRTKQEFKDFNLQIEFNVPKGGNSGIYLLGRYEVQVVDRDSRMQGRIGVGSLFSRIEPSENAGEVGGEWQKYDITLVNRHITVVLNNIKVIDNMPLMGPTQGALDANVTKSGPIYLQGDHTAVKYRNIVLRPVIY